MNEGMEIGRAILSLILVAGLMGLCVLVARKFGIGRYAGETRKNPRLGIIESRMIDPRHRLVLVRRDHVEHLLLLGQGKETLVIETNVASGPTPAGNLHG